MRDVGKEFQFILRQLVFYGDTVTQRIEISDNTETEVTRYGYQNGIDQVSPSGFPERRSYYDFHHIFFSPDTGGVAGFHM